MCQYWQNFFARQDKTMAQSKAHDRTRPEVVDEEDPVEKMLMKTGCIDLHYAVQVV